jgi:hypothetical protein
MRGVLTPNLPHMSLVAVVLALVVISAIFWTLGIRSFIRRSVQ